MSVIIKVIDNHIYVHNILEENCLELEEDFVNTLDFNKTYEIENNTLIEKPDLNSSKYDKINYLISVRDEYLANGYTSPTLKIKVRSTLTDIDMFDRVSKLMERQKKLDTDTRQIQLYDNSLYSITKNDLDQLLVELGTNYDFMWNQYKTLQYKIQIAKSIDELNSIDIKFS